MIPENVRGIAPTPPNPTRGRALPGRHDPTPSHFPHPRRDTLLKFVRENQCPHCAGLTAGAWSLAEKFARAEGLMFMFPGQPKVCPGTCVPLVALTASQMEEIIRLARPAFNEILADVVAHVSVPTDGRAA